MKKKLIVLTTVILAYVGINAQPVSFDLSTVPEEVKKNANVIKRYEDIRFEVTDIDRAILYTHQVITVLNEKGKDELEFRAYASRYYTLEEVDIKVFDAKGKQITRYKKKDLRSQAIGSGLIDDGKIFYIDISAPAYPITVEYEYEERFKGTLAYPRFEIIKPGQGVENSTFSAKVPKELDLRFKVKNIALKAEVSEDGKYKNYKWVVKGLSPIDFEEGAVSYRHRYPSIQLAPNHFKMEDYEGDMTSWNKFGEWYITIKKQKDVLPEDRQAFFKEMVKNAKDDREKARLIYNYLQKNFRYVSIQLGLGGWRPFPANFTDQKKYGDCKGLSNYTQAALDAVGVKSYQALINRDSKDLPVDPDFPCNLFNHVILFVPFKNDSVWLECTSNTLDFGVLDMSTQNRNALLITEKGGVLVPTPKSKAAENLFLATTTVDLSEEGSGVSTTTLTTSGEYREEMLEYLFDQKEDDQKTWLIQRYGFKQPDVFSVTRTESPNPSTTIKMEIEKIPEFTAGSKMFLTSRIYKLWAAKLPRSENRKQDFYFPQPFDKRDTTVFKLPAGFKSEALPQPKDLKCEFATYSTKYWYDEPSRSLYSTAKLVLTNYKIPAAQYADVKKFFDEVLMDDSQRIVIKKE